MFAELQKKLIICEENIDYIIQKNNKAITQLNNQKGDAPELPIKELLSLINNFQTKYDLEIQTLKQLFQELERKNNNNEENQKLSDKLNILFSEVVRIGKELEELQISKQTAQKEQQDQLTQISQLSQMTQQYGNVIQNYEKKYQTMEETISKIDQEISTINSTNNTNGGIISSFAIQC